MNDLNSLLINTFWYRIRVYMNNPGEWINADEVIASKLYKASYIDNVLDELDNTLNEQGISKRIERNTNLTLGDLLNQIHNFKNLTKHEQI